MLPALVLALLGACASMEPPRGGPEDHTPPELVAAFPESGSVALGAGVDRLEFLFSEKLAVVPAERLLRFYPPLEVAKTRWKGRRRLIVELQEPLPADTVVVVRLPAGYSDNHRVRAPRARTVVLATGDSLPTGRIEALVTLDGDPAPAAILELYAAAADTPGAGPQTPLRVSSGDSLGHVVSDWLPVPGGPWTLRVFQDANGDGRPADTEPQRAWPGTWDLSEELRSRNLGVLALFSPRTAGRLVAAGPGPGWAGSVFGWTMKIAEEDTGFVPEHPRRRPAGWAAMAADSSVWDDAGPGLTRLILFTDLDGDSLLSALPDSVPGDSLAWFWEPFAVLDSLEVEPGRPLGIELPGPPDARIRCLSPPVAAVPRDTLAAADSTSAVDAEPVPEGD